jgi:hypothetical protein
MKKLVTPSLPGHPGVLKRKNLCSPPAFDTQLPRPAEHKSFFAAFFAKKAVIFRRANRLSSVAFTDNIIAFDHRRQKCRALMFAPLGMALA